MKKYLFAGFITLLPIALTIMIVMYLFDLMTAPFVGIVESILLSYEKQIGISFHEHQTAVLLISRILAFIMLFLLILLLGVLGRKFFFNIFLRMTHQLFLRIPIVKSVYKLTKDITSAVFSEKEKTFKQTILVPFPAQNTYTLAFTTGEVPEKLKKFIPQADVTVFVPTAPHPMSGYILFTPKKYAQEVDVTIEEAFKFLLSCGMIHPGQEVPGRKEPTVPPIPEEKGK